MDRPQFTPPSIPNELTGMSLIVLEMRLLRQEIEELKEAVKTLANPKSGS